MVTARSARLRLERGNADYRATGEFRGRVDAERRKDLASGQHPYAIVVSCSDSRVLPEAVFSASLGELFSIRVAGNVIGEHVLGSIQYAHEHLGCKLVVVLGHSNCGAVHAAFEGGATGYAGSLVSPIRELTCGCADERAAAIANARAGAARVREAFPSADLEVMPAFYDIESGEVEWL